MKESIDSNRILGVADDKGANKLIINSKCIMIMMSLYSPFKVFYIPQVFYCVKQMSDIPNIIHRFPHTTISNKEIQLHISQFILYIYLVVLTPHQNMIKTFLHIS